jgi:hypothetical protein
MTLPVDVQEHMNFMTSSLDTQMTLQETERYFNKSFCEMRTYAYLFFTVCVVSCEICS